MRIEPQGSTRSEGPCARSPWRAAHALGEPPERLPARGLDGVPGRGLSGSPGVFSRLCACPQGGPAPGARKRDSGGRLDRPGAYPADSERKWLVRAGPSSSRPVSEERVRHPSDCLAPLPLRCMRQTEIISLSHGTSARRRRPGNTTWAEPRRSVLPALKNTSLIQTSSGEHGQNTDKSTKGLGTLIPRPLI